MAIPLYLAQTPWEFTQNTSQIDHTAWMACRFSSSGTGLSHIPGHLPKDSLLVLDDMTPPHGHDIVQIKATLSNIAENFSCRGILLDFQRPDNPESHEIIKSLLTLPCPVFVSDIYATDLDCPVFLPPIPPWMIPEEYLKPWKTREIFLETAIQTQTLTVTEKGCKISDCMYGGNHDLPFYNEKLFCHYCLSLSEEQAVFTLHRTKSDICALLTDLEQLGVTGCVGLYEDLK